MDSPYSPLEFHLLNDWQRDFPLTPRPFAEVGRKVGAGETATIATLARLQARGAISRVGAVFAPRRVGASTLAALAAPAERLEAIAAMVSARPEVNHNYQREHHYNLWFVIAAADAAALARSLAAISRESGCEVLSLPLQQEYHIDLGFDLKPRSDRQRPHHGGTPGREPTADERSLIAALQPGLALVPRPFAEAARAAGMGEAEALRRIGGWIDEGLIKRFGVVVRHHELGFRANAMVVFDLPDATVDAVGARLAAEPSVTLCYRRARSLPHWPYNLYCMVHGRSREEVQPVIDRLGEIAGRPGLALFSTRRFKQCGAMHFTAPAP